MTVKKRHGLFQSVTFLTKTSLDLICDAQYMMLPENVTNKILWRIFNDLWRNCSVTD